MSLIRDTIHPVYGNFRGITHDLGISQWVFKGITWENDLFEIIGKYIRPNTTIIDVGANIGTHTVGILNKYLKDYLKNGVDISDTHVVAVEPQPFIFDILKHNVNNNDTPVKKTLLNCGFSNEACTVYMNMPDYSTCENPGGYGIQFNRIPSDKSTRVDVITLDSLNFENVSFMKIDVEGHEVQVIKGALETIKKYRPVMIVEILGGCPYEKASAHYKKVIDDTKEFIRSIGYSCERAGNRLCDYLCLPL